MSVWCKWVIISFSLGNIVFADPIQFDLVNKVMQDIVNEATKYDEVIDYVAPKFDEKYSDLQVGRLRYTLKGALKNTPWKPGHKSQVFAASILKVRNHPRQRGISAFSQAQFQTDSLALIRLAAKEALKRPLAPPPRYKIRIMNHLVQLSEVKDLTHLYQILLAAKRLSLEIQQDQMRRGNLSAAKYNEIRKSIEQFLILAELKGKKVYSIVIRSGKASQLALSGSFSVVPEFAQLIIREKTMYFGVMGFAPMTKERIEGLKSELASALAGIQMNYKEETERQLAMYKRALELYKQTIREK